MNIILCILCVAAIWLCTSIIKDLKHIEKMFK